MRQGDGLSHSGEMTTTTLQGECMGSASCIPLSTKGPLRARGARNHTEECREPGQDASTAGSASMLRARMVRDWRGMRLTDSRETVEGTAKRNGRAVAPMGGHYGVWSVWKGWERQTDCGCRTPGYCMGYWHMPSAC